MLLFIFFCKKYILLSEKSRLLFHNQKQNCFTKMNHKPIFFLKYSIHSLCCEDQRSVISMVTKSNRSSKQSHLYLYHTHPSQATAQERQICDFYMAPRTKTLSHYFILFNELTAWLFHLAAYVFSSMRLKYLNLLYRFKEERTNIA